MTNQKDTSIRRAIDVRLSGMESGPNFERNVLGRVRGDIKVKRKLSAAFVMTAILVLTATAVLATSLFTGIIGGNQDLQNTYTASSATQEIIQAATYTAEPTAELQPTPVPYQLVEYDTNPGQILINARSVLTEIYDYSVAEADQFTTSAECLYSNLYCNGTEPVWIVTLSLHDIPMYKVLLGYDGKHIDSVKANEEFTIVDRSDEQLGFTSGSEQYNAQGEYFYDWTLEEKAVFSRKWRPAAALFAQRNPYFTGEDNHVWAWTRREYGLPDQDSITQDAALALAQEAAIQLGADENFVRSPDNVYYFYDITDNELPLWLVILSDKATSEGLTERYFVTLDALTGTVLDAYSDTSADSIDDFLRQPYQQILADTATPTPESAAGTLVMEQMTAQLHSYDATEAEALAAAKAALENYSGLPQGEAEVYAARAEFVYSVWYNWGEEPVWLVTFSVNGVAEYKVLLGYDASYIDWAPADEQFSQLFRQGDELGDYTELNNEQGVAFFDWTLEEKAAFSAKWTPIAEAYKAENPYFTGSRNNFWQWTRRSFGLPSETDIQQDEALEIAKEHLKQYGETDETLSQIYDVEYFFDVTEPEQPQWRMCIYWLADFENNNVENERHYFIKIDAITGEILQIIICPQGFDVTEILSEFISEP